MKKTFLFVVVILIVQYSEAQSKKVLFLGNSYTASNNLPATLSDLAESMGNSLIYDSNTPGGYTLQGHSTNTTSQSKIEADAWDFVVLQEQSQIPSFPIGQVENDCFPFAQSLAESIREANPCAVPLFYMTWGRENGDQGNCENWPPVCTYEGMQDLLSERYMQMGIDNEAWVSPVGEAWRMARELDENIELYTGDGSHPNSAGTYLTACVFYGSIWQESPIGTTFNDDLDSETAIFLQQVAHDVVFGEEDWNQYSLDYYDLDVTTEDGLSTISADLNPYVESIEIQFDDQVFVLADGESIELTLVEGANSLEISLNSDCVEWNETIEVNINTSVHEISRNHPVLLYPNPSVTYVFIELDGFLSNFEVEVSDHLGRIISSQVFTENQRKIKIDMPEKKGTYFVKVWNEKREILSSEKVVKI